MQLDFIVVKNLRRLFFFSDLRIVSSSHSLCVSVKLFAFSLDLMHFLCCSILISYTRVYIA